MELEPAILDALHSKDRYQRMEAILSLSGSGDRDALAQLQPLLHDPDVLVSTSALYATWMISGEFSGPKPGMDAALESALAALASDDEEQVQTAAGVLAQIGDALLPELQARLSNQSPYAIPILRLLGDIGGPQSLRLVKDARQSKQAGLAAAAQAVLDEWDE